MKFIRTFLFVLAASIALTAQAVAPFDVMYTLGDTDGTAEGVDPEGGLVRGADDNYYGTAYSGGDDGLGTIFRINIQTATPTFERLFSFPATPLAPAHPTSLMRDRDDYLYGTTDTGGVHGLGTIFKLNPDGTNLQVIYSFTCSVAAGLGGIPWGTLTEGPDGALYGATNPDGGVEPSCADVGTVFKINKDGSSFQALHTFYWTLTGGVTFGPVAVGDDGSVYGTTMDSAVATAPGVAFGTVYKLSPSENPLQPYAFTPLHAFNGADGAYPAIGLTRGENGVFYGTTSAGGDLFDPDDPDDPDDSVDPGSGTIFRINADDSFEMLYSFDPIILYFPSTPLVSGGDGKLYGLAAGGGPDDNGGTFIFNLADNTLLLHYHLTATESTFPAGMLTVGADRHLYGAIAGDGSSADQGLLYGLGNITILNRPPFAVATATPPSPIEALVASGRVVTLDGSGSSDPDFDNLFYAWTLPPGTTIMSGTTSSVSLVVGFPIGAGQHVVLNVTDSLGRVTPANLDVSVVDLPPTIGPVADITTPATGSAGAVVNFPTPSATDTIDGSPPVTCLPASGSTFPIASTPVTCSATDSHSNTATSTFQVIVVGLAVTVPADFTVEADRLAGRPVNYSGLVSAADGNGSVPVSCGPLASGSVFPLDVETTITCTAKTAVDSDTKSFKVSVVDTTKPFVFSHGVITASTGPGGAVIIYQGPSINIDPDFVPYAVDIVDGSISLVTCTPPSGSTFPIGHTAITCTATDSHGNVGTNLVNLPLDNDFWVRDADYPVITIPANIFEEATGPTGATATFSVTATDVSDPSPIVSCNAISGVTLFPLGTTTVTCKATDHSGNPQPTLVPTPPETYGSFTVTVVDTTGPAIPTLPNIITTTSNPAGTFVSYPGVPATVLDLVDGSVALGCVPPAGSTFLPGTTTLVTCTAVDAHSNLSRATFNVTVNLSSDTTPPVIGVLASMTVEATGPSGAVVMFRASAFDAVDGPVPVTCVPPSGSTFPLNTLLRPWTIVTCTASDASSNSASKTFKVKVRDTTPPAVTVPGNIVKVTTSSSGVVVTFTASALDLVSGATVVVCRPASGSTFPVGTTTVICKSTDGVGNVGTKTFTVKVVKVTAKLSPGLLWPPNHKMVNIVASITAPAGTTIKLISITSNEPDNGLGDGDTPKDIQGATLGTDDRVFQLRAERSGRGRGRVYTVEYRATNADSSITVVATVIVPHDMRGDDGKDRNGKDRDDRDDHGRDDSHECDGRDGHNIHRDDYRDDRDRR